MLCFDISGEKEVPSVALGKAKFESTMRSLLLVYQYRVELYKNKGGKGARQMWYLAGKVCVASALKDVHSKQIKELII